MAEQNKSKMAPVSEDVAEEIVSALHTLHGLIATYGSEKLPDFPTDPYIKSQENDKLYERVMIRSRAAILRRVEWMAEEAAKAYKGAVDAIVAPFVAKQNEARDAYMAIPEAARAYVPAFPTTVKVPLETVWVAFPSELNNAQKVGILHTLGYKLADEKGKKFLYTDLPAHVPAGTTSAPRMVG